MHADLLWVQQLTRERHYLHRRQLLQPRHGDLAAEVLQTHWHNWGQKSTGNNWGTR
jgi:hypothetical protein